MNTIKVNKIGDRVELLFPYHEEAKTRIKNLGGRWDGAKRLWWVQPEMEAEARRVLIDAFGTDGSADVQTVVVRVTALRRVTEYTEPVVCCGKILARAWSRDSGAKVGEDVALLEGSIRSGGSRKNWTTIVDEGSVFKLVNVLPARLDEYDAEDFKVEVVDGEELANNPLAQYSDDDILTEARRRGLMPGDHPSREQSFDPEWDEGEECGL